MAKDYYKILGVSKSASQDEIKKAFRTLAHEHHPDKKTGNADKFKEINEAYQVLGNEQKRREFDQFGQTSSGAGSNNGGGGFSGSGGNPFGQGFGGYNQGNANFDFSDLGDLFGGMFGGGGMGASQSSSGRDLETELTISFEEAVFGVEKTIDLSKQIVCDICGGTGAEPGSKTITCKTCNGQGRVVRMQQTILGNFQTSTICSDCHGKGKRPEKNCLHCHGVGHIQGREQIKVSIPAGVDDGQSVKITGKGDIGENGRAGNLYILLRVKANKNFVRRGDDIYSINHLKLKQAILGDKIEILTVDGPVALKIPEGTQSQTEFRLRGKGVPHLREHGRGDHLVQVIVDIPKNLTRQQKKLLEQL